MNTRQPIKIAHVITRLIVGGAQENTLLSARELQKSGVYDVCLISGPECGPEGSLMPAPRSSLRVKVIPSLRRNINPLNDSIALLHLWWFMRREKFALVHTHSSKAGILGRLAARLNRVPVIVHTIHGLPFFPGQHRWLNWLFIRLERWAAGWTARLVCVAPAIAAQAQAAAIGTAAQYTTIYSGMNIAAFRTDEATRLAARSRLGIAPDALVIGKIARLFHFKGHEFLLQALAGLKDRFPRLIILLVGDGILRRRIAAQADERGLREHIRFAGLVPPRDIPGYVAACDIIAHVSLREGLPRAVVQAGAAAIPAVCFAVDGAVDVITHGVDGFLVPPGDVDALQARLGELLQDRALRERMGAAAQNKVSGLFTAERMIAQLDRLYAQLLSGAAPIPTRRLCG